MTCVEALSKPPYGAIVCISHEVCERRSTHQTHTTTGNTQRFLTRQHTLEFSPPIRDAANAAPGTATPGATKNLAHLSNPTAATTACAATRTWPYSAAVGVHRRSSRRRRHFVAAAAAAAATPRAQPPPASPPTPPPPHAESPPLPPPPVRRRRGRRRRYVVAAAAAAAATRPTSPLLAPPASAAASRRQRRQTSGRVTGCPRALAIAVGPPSPCPPRPRLRPRAPCCRLSTPTVARPAARRLRRTPPAWHGRAAAASAAVSSARTAPRLPPNRGFPPLVWRPAPAPRRPHFRGTHPAKAAAAGAGRQRALPVAPAPLWWASLSGAPTTWPPLPFAASADTPPGASLMPPEDGRGWEGNLAPATAPPTRAVPPPDAAAGGSPSAPACAGPPRGPPRADTFRRPPPATNGTARGG